jgi:protein-S-isoprenylcysteine O-methyltransferase Ste14
MPNENTLLLVYFLAYFLLGFVWRSWLVYRCTGINPLVLPPTQDAYGYVGRAFKVAMAACAVVVVLLAAHPESGAWLGPVRHLQQASVAEVGWLCLIVSLLWMVVAQSQMGASWRVGIDSARRTPLVSHGLFGVSRNPIFLAMRVSLLGFFLVVPNAATLALLTVGEVLIQVQVRLEEHHLSQLHTDAYDSYCAKVPRWL